MKRKVATLLGIGLLGGVSTAGAAGVENVTFSGFLTAGAAYAARPVLAGTDVVLADGSITNEVTFGRDTRFGLQITAKVNPDVSVTGQMLARGVEQNFTVLTDWAYVKYRVNNNISIRAGRVKLPSFLISDYNEVGYAYPWVRPPMEMYSANPMTGLNGVDALMRFNLGDLSLLVQPFYGTNTQSTTVPQAVIGSGAPLCLTPPPGPVSYVACPAGTIVHTDFTVENLRGINLSLGSDVFTVRAGWFKTQVSAPAFGVKGDDGSFSSVGATMDWKNIVIYTEGFVRIVEGGANAAFPNQEGGYGTFGYRLGKFLPHVTYGWIDDHNNPTPGMSLKQKSVALGLRYEMGRGAAFKFEALRATPEAGTAGLLLSNPDAVGAPSRNESVMIYSTTFDVVF
jgi:hypothetical protein